MREQTSSCVEKIFTSYASSPTNQSYCFALWICLVGLFLDLLSMEEINVVLNNFLKDHAESFILDRQRRLTEIDKVINPILREVKKMDEQFDFDTFRPNSFYTIKSPSHYEILLVFQGIDPNEIAIEDGQTPPGFALARLTGKRMISRWKFCTGNSNPSKVYLSAKTVKEKLCDYVKRVVKSGAAFVGGDGKSCVEIDDTHNDGAILLSVRGQDSEPFSLDLIPTIPFPGRWVFSAQAWETKLPDWPNKYLKEETLQSGIHLVARPSPSKSSYQWQIGFPVPMRKMLELELGCRTKCLLILDIIVEDMLAGRPGCNPFHLETVVMHVTEQIPVRSFWDEDKFAKRFMDVVKELQKCLLERNLGHVFLPNVNLFRDVDKLALESCKEGLQKVLQDPVKFLCEFELFKYTTNL